MLAPGDSREHFYGALNRGVFMKMVKAIIESFESDDVKHALTTADIGSFLQPSKRLG
jgi:hypothetical protein